MNHSRILRVALAAAAALLMVFAAAPANAEHPEPEPQSFNAWAPGSEECTYLGTVGEISRRATHPPEQPRVEVTGSRSVAVPGGTEPEPCPPVAIAPQQIEFTFSGAGLPLGEHSVPFPANTYPLPDYAFAFEAPTQIDAVEIAICQERNPDGSTWPGRCGDSHTIEFDANPDPYCEYEYTIPNVWGSGYQAHIGVTPLVEDAQWWGVEIDPPFTIHHIWNADATQGGSHVVITPTSWNSTVPVGQSAYIGFIGSGDPPAPSDIRVHVNGVDCVEA